MSDPHEQAKSRKQNGFEFDKAYPFTNENLSNLIPPPSGQREYPDPSVTGLRLRVFAGGAKSFILRKRVGGVARNISLGRLDASFGVEDARRMALEIITSSTERTADYPKRTNVWEVDPAAAPIGELFGDYLVAKARLKSVREIERIFVREISPRIGARSALELSRSDVTRLLEEIPSRAMGRAVAAQLSSFYAWLMQRSDALRFNPCIGASRPRPLAPRDRVLSSDEMATLWSVLRKEPVFGPGVKLLILTLQRRSEVFDASCREFDLPQAKWAIPASRTKNGRRHEVPLTEHACAILKQHLRGRPTGKLFPSKENPERSISGFSKAWSRIVAAVETEIGRPLERFTLHDLRRTGATQLQRLGVKLEVTEAILNHVSGTRGGLVGVYQCYDYVPERRTALMAWEAELAKIIKSPDRYLRLPRSTSRYLMSAQ